MKQMAKQSKKEKKKLKKTPIIIVCVLLCISILVGYRIKIARINNIFIYGNKYVTDDEIISLAELMDYPEFYYPFSFQIANKIEKNPYIKSVKVKKKFYHVIEITVEENIPLFIKDSEDKIVLMNDVEIDNDKKLSLPRVVNYIPDTIYERFVSKMGKLDEIVRSKISEIKYKPSEYDEERFILYMNDGNYVYLTLTKFEYLEYYNEVYETLEGKKGILYLDSGNHFVIAR